MDSDKKAAAPAAGRLLDLVELLAAEHDGLSIHEIARRLDIPVNAVYRIVQEMESRGYLDRLGDRGSYQLGSRFYQIGQRVGGRLDLRRQALPVMHELRESCGETIHLCILQRGWLVLLDQLETEQPIRIHVETGSLMVPHASAFGKCLLAFARDDIREDLLREPLVRLTGQTIVSRDILAHELEIVRQRGWAPDDQEYMDGVRCLGAPVYQAGGCCTAALGIMGPAYRLSSAWLEAQVPLVCRAAVRLSAAMGYSRPGEVL
ncbi:MAG: IclR family transcriptional regulator [Clostridiaceae bacterium]|nr:IclR family transcriptional regulator [Clostridiaceae bacterium]